MISRIVKVEVGVMSQKLRLITLTKTLMIWISQKPNLSVLLYSEQRKEVMLLLLY